MTLSPRSSLIAGVVGFYDTHPINEEEILARLAASGRGVGIPSMNELKDFDQDHYGGTDAVDLLIQRAGIRSGQHVLDVCSGMGGPARWIAFRTGCRVTGVDLTQSRVEGATRLTRLVRLEHLVDFVQGDATALPLADRRYDVLIGEEAWCHVPDKPALIGQCVRVVKAGGAIAFTDIVTRSAMTRGEQARLAAEMHMPKLASAQGYADLLTRSGCAIESSEDLSEEWKSILVERLKMYRSLRETTVAKFGEAGFERYDRAYSHFVGLFTAGRLGGARIVARASAVNRG